MFHHRVLAASRNHREGENSRRERDHLDRLHNILAYDHEACRLLSSVFCHLLLLSLLSRINFVPHLLHD